MKTLPALPLALLLTLAWELSVIRNWFVLMVILPAVPSPIDSDASLLPFST